MANKVITGMCLSCTRNVTRVLVDGLVCQTCWLREHPGKELPGGEAELPVVEPVKLPPPPRKPKVKPIKPAKRKKSRRPRPQTAIWSPSELFFQVLTRKALMQGQFQIGKWALSAFSQAVSDIDRLRACMGPDGRDIKSTAKSLGWTVDYTHAVYRDSRDWEENQLISLIQMSGGLVKGRNFIAEAAERLGWPKIMAWNAYRRLKRKGVRRDIHTEDKILEVLESGGEMSASQIAAVLRTSPRWVYQVIAHKLSDRVEYREDNNFGWRIYRLSC